jgi:hypothetical protein
MVYPFRQDQRRPALTGNVQHVLDDEGIARVVAGQRVINFVNGRLLGLDGKPKGLSDAGGRDDETAGRRLAHGHSRDIECRRIASG